MNKSSKVIPVIIVVFCIVSAIHCHRHEDNGFLNLLQDLQCSLDMLNC